MVEIRRGTDISGTPGAARGPGDRLPWLEPVEDEDGYGGEGYGGGSPGEPAGGYGGVVMAGLGVLVAIALITAGVVWFRHHRAATGDIGAVIHPEPGPYKVKPANPGGLDTDETGTVAAGTSAGEDIDSVLDLNAVPEAPVVTRARAPKPGAPAPRVIAQGAPPPQPRVALPAPMQAKPLIVPTVPSQLLPATPPPQPTAGSGGTIQLGAFGSEAKAKAAYKSLSARFAFLKDMTPVVSATEAGDKTLYRLRASGAPMPAAQLCARMRVAGESCVVIGG